MHLESVTQPPDPTGPFQELQEGFRATHRSAMNLWLHLFTTPLGLVGSLALLGVVHPVLPAVVGLVFLDHHRDVDHDDRGLEPDRRRLVALGRRRRRGPVAVGLRPSRW